MKDYSFSDEAPWIYLGLATVVIENGVTSIGDHAFNNSAITSVTISNSVTSIGNNAFASCCFTSVIIPSSVISIGTLAFAYNIVLSEVINLATMPQTINSIVFMSANLGGCTLMVPESAISDYSTAMGWQSFGNIIVYDGNLSTGPTELYIANTRNINDHPNFVSRSFRLDFKLRSKIGVPGSGTYSTSMTVSPWVNTDGGLVHQLNFNDGGIFYRTGVFDNPSWNAWRKLVVETAGGNVGIGTDSPTEKLHVDGNAFLNGNVGIGISTPAHKLDVAGAIQSNGVFYVDNNLAGSTGTSNVSFGNMALSSNTTGGFNTAIGSSALRYNTVGSENTACGSHALLNNTDGSYNTANGINALRFNTNGTYNTAVGTEAGYYNRNFNNATAIGYDAQNTASDQVVLGNSSVTRIVGYNNLTITSDGRTKRNIRTEVPGLAFINILQPIMYNLDLDALDEIMKPDNPEINRLRDSLRLERSPEEKEILAKARTNKEKQVYSGFIAQDVEKAAQSVGYNFSGVDAPENEKKPYGLRYADFIVPLVKAVQELSGQNEAKDSAIASLREQVNELTARLDDLTNAPKSQNVKIIGGSEDEKNFSFTLIPNPTNGFVTIDYSLIVDAPMCIELYNMFGQRLKLIVPRQNLNAGTYSVQISVGDLSTGTYIVRVSSGNHVESKQLVINL